MKAKTPRYSNIVQHLCDKFGQNHFNLINKAIQSELNTKNTLSNGSLNVSPSTPLENLLSLFVHSLTLLKGSFKIRFKRSKRIRQGCIVMRRRWRPHQCNRRHETKAQHWTARVAYILQSIIHQVLRPPLYSETKTTRISSLKTHPCCWSQWVPQDGFPQCQLRYKPLMSRWTDTSRSSNRVIWLSNQRSIKEIRPIRKSRLSACGIC